MTIAGDRSKAIVHRLFEDVWNRGDMSATVDILAHPEGVERYVAEFRAAFPDVHHEVREMTAKGDAVAVTWTAQATHAGHWRGLAPRGKVVTWTGITIAHLQGGKIADHHTLWDRLSFAEQLGTVLPQSW
jgi:predicted ester cyclase